MAGYRERAAQIKFPLPPGGLAHIDAPYAGEAVLPSIELDLSAEVVAVAREALAAMYAVDHPESSGLDQFVANFVQDVYRGVFDGRRSPGHESPDYHNLVACSKVNRALSAYLPRLGASPGASLAQRALVLLRAYERAVFPA